MEPPLVASQLEELRQIMEDPDKAVASLKELPRKDVEEGEEVLSAEVKLEYALMCKEFKELAKGAKENPPPDHVPDAMSNLVVKIKEFMEKVAPIGEDYRRKWEDLREDLRREQCGQSLVPPPSTLHNESPAPNGPSLPPSVDAATNKDSGPGSNKN